MNRKSQKKGDDRNTSPTSSNARTIAEPSDQLARIESKLDELLAGRKDVLTLPEVARMLRRSKGNIYKLTMQALIPHYKRGKQLLFDREEILQWIREGRVAPLYEIEQTASTFITLNT